MKRSWLLVLILVGTVGSQEVKHAPTVEQCRADQRLWLSKLEDDSVSSVGYKELLGWSEEMAECRTVDPEFRNRYYNTGSEVQAETVVRLLAFLERHNLYNQFTVEDEQGKRR